MSLTRRLDRLEQTTGVGTCPECGGMPTVEINYREVGQKPPPPKPRCPRCGHEAMHIVVFADHGENAAS